MGEGEHDNNLPRRPGTTPKMIHSVGHSRMVVDRKGGGGSGLVVIPRMPKTIWFAGSGMQGNRYAPSPLLY